MAEPTARHDPRRGPLHPAKFSEPILEVLARMVRQEQRRLGRPVTVLDPFAGVGRVHRFAREGQVETVGVEIQRSWADLHDRTVCADSLDWMARTGPGYSIPKPLDDRPEWGITPHVGGMRAFVGFDLVVTSPTYGNRFSDSHNAQDGSQRRSYAHDLRAQGDDLEPGSSAGMPWGERYWQFHALAYRRIRDVLRPPGTFGDDDPGGLLLLNVSDFVKGKAMVPATLWHRGACHGAGMVDDGRPRFVETQRNGHGENRDARAPSEVIYRMRPAVDE